MGQQPVALLFAPAVVESGQGGDQHGYQRNPSGTAHQARTLPGAVGGTSACDPAGGFPLGDRDITHLIILKQPMLISCLDS